ncbi:DNA-binding response regulator [Streptomyces albiflavescens]|uniref:DNA-binding response regulator n=1 Tax=Streptomyces albiflavescens TaxID=1623582 RepID=A0A917Y683_9ACTN|nr:response regulator transcription factor [Streptomyces albiflavescens]GGN71919.1 DNA-binding response regulator [Streptomyces albiflavescens]
MRIGIIDKGNLFRGDLRAALDSQPFLTVAVEGTQLDIIVSSHVHGRDSAEVLRVAAQANPAIPVLVIAERVSEREIRRILTMGAAGILLQETAAQHVSWAIPAISNGCRALSPEIAESMISEYLGSSSMTPQEQSARERVHRLSHREQEVLHLLGRGMSNREIARSLFISPETVKDHVRAIRSKLSVPTRVHAAHVAWLARGATAGNAA